MSKTAGYQQSFSLRFLLPGYWFAWLGLLILWLLNFFPLSIKRQLSRVLGNLIYRNNKKRRHIVEINLAIAFPRLDVLSREKMARKLFCNAVFVLLDYPLLLWAGKKTLNKRIHVKGLEHIEHCQLQHRPVILLTCHMLGLEYGALGLTRQLPAVGLINPARNPLFAWLSMRGRTRFQGELYQRSQGLRPVIRAMKQNKIFYYLPDEDLGEKAQSRFVPFFGAETATINALPRLATMTGAAVLPAVTTLDIETGIYTLEIEQPLPGFPGHDDKTGELENLQRMNQVLQQLIMHAPSQYMWSLRLFQTRPAGAASPYNF